MGKSAGRVIQAEGIIRGKALGQEFTWHVQRTVRRLMWLDHSK